MKFLIRALFFACVAATLPAVAAAEDGAAANTSAEQRIRAHFLSSRPDLKIDSVSASPISGLYEVAFTNGPRVYSTADGKYFVLGDLYEVGAGGFVNLAEAAREAERAELMAKVASKDMIVFSPEGKPKASIYVFTDTDCGYCQKLHREVPELNKLGIEVRYLAYPRAGVGSPTFNKMASAWCAKDPQTALTALKNRQKIDENVCPNNPIAAQYQLGSQVGVTGTPAIVTTSGTLIPGYMPAARLAGMVTQK